MATLTFTFETGVVTLNEITNAFATAYNRPDTVPDPNTPGATIPNPETKAQFARRMVRQFIIETVKSQRIKTARATADAGVTDPTFTD